MAVNNLVKRLQNVMRQDAGISGDAQRIEQMTWTFFLKVYDAQEDEWDFKSNGAFHSIIPERMRWRNWATDKKDGSALTGDELLNFVNNELFPTLQKLPLVPDSPRAHWIVKEVFADLNQYMKNGVLLRQVVNIVDEIDFTDADDRHTFGDIYEGILKDLQSAGNAGEFYTPRALTDFIIETLNPRLGESVADYTSGTGGFLTSALNYLAAQRKTPQDEEIWQNSVHGQEWKPLPYLLSITNLLVHGVDEPDIIHCDSLGTPVSSFTDKDRANVIAMNPPYGGSTEASVKMNFPADVHTSETAELFMILIMRRLKKEGRAGVVISDGFLFGSENAEIAIKSALLRDFNLHTIIRLPDHIFSPYTDIHTNLVFFNNETAEGAEDGFRTKDVWFYRLDMPEDFPYKHFSKTHPMELNHCQPIREWWNNRREIITTDEEGNIVDEKSRCFTAQQLIELSCNFDQCKFPKSEEVVLPTKELITEYHRHRDAFDQQIDIMLHGVEQILSNKRALSIPSTRKVFEQLAELQQNFPARLRNSILYEAVQGKLVSQDKNDKPAIALLERIQQEKQKLVKEKILKAKDIVVSPIPEDELPFDIPKTWSWCRLGELAFEKMGKTPPRGDSTYWANPKYPWVSISDMKDYAHVKATKEAVSEFAAKKAFKQISPKGSLLMSFKLTVGRTSILDIEAYHNEAIITIQPYYDQDHMFRNYLFYVLPLLANMGDSKDAIKGKTLNSTSLYNLYIPLPPLAEQQRIVAKIEELFEQIDKISK